uniref:Uncharacterized protein n=1 Tax=Panagrolaimus sp. PS1159 TaxID=55785 RepID=A0AC35FC53_9BILA
MGKKGKRKLVMNKDGQLVKKEPPKPHSPKFGAFLPILNDIILLNVAEGYMTNENAVIYIMDGLHIFTKEVMKNVYASITNYLCLPNVAYHLKTIISDRTHPYQLYLNFARNITAGFREKNLYLDKWGKPFDEQLAECLYNKIQEQFDENFRKLYEIVKQNEEIEKLLKFHIAAGYQPNGTEIANSFDAFRECKETSKKNVNLKVRLIAYIDREKYPDLESRKNQYGNVVEEDDDHNLKFFKAEYKKLCDYYKKNPESRKDKYGNDIALKEIKIVKDEQGEDVIDENGNVVTEEHWHPKFISVDLENCAYYHLDRLKFKCHYLGFAFDKTRVFIIQTPTAKTLHDIYYNVFHQSVHLMEWGGTTDSEGKMYTQVSENLQAHEYVYHMKLGKAMFKLTGKKRDKGN